MKRLFEEVTVVKTIADQIIDAPVETVIVAKSRYSRHSDKFGTDALVKTGTDGYQQARGSSKYLHHVDIKGWVESQGVDAEFYLIEV